MGNLRGPGRQPEPKPPARVVPRRGIAHLNLADPTEFATLATFPLEARPARCTQFPTGALADLGPTDAPAPVQERSGNPIGFPSRPENFGDSRSA